MINKIKQELRNNFLLKYWIKVKDSDEAVKINDYLLKNDFKWNGSNPDIFTIKKIDYYIINKSSVSSTDGSVIDTYIITYLIGGLRESYIATSKNNIFINCNDLISKDFIDDLFKDII